MNDNQAPDAITAGEIDEAADALLTNRSHIDATGSRRIDVPIEIDGPAAEGAPR